MIPWLEPSDVVDVIKLDLSCIINSLTPPNKIEPIKTYNMIDNTHEANNAVL